MTRLTTLLPLIALSALAACQQRDEILPGTRLDPREIVSPEGPAVEGPAGVTSTALNLSAAGVETDDRGFVVTDEHQRTSVPGLWAAGDVVRGLNQIAVATAEAAALGLRMPAAPLGHAASDARAAIENFSRRVIPAMVPVGLGLRRLLASYGQRS